ncbi:17740_t:CDS:2 [Funneliformis caledonium]|uniref:17740_t:CDS:1 n=1 Tax=Funneliformis caledonium TaxID=1117310 RepID=A0A9N9BY34_9GLOM|nr:17740_t:CDS:2 [Funneliformis caledonium]
MNSFNNFPSLDSSYNHFSLQHQLNQPYQQVIPITLTQTSSSNSFDSPPSPSSPRKAVALAYAQRQVFNNSSPYHKVFQSPQEQIHQPEIYIPATDYPSPCVDSYDSAEHINLNNGMMTESTSQATTSSPPSFSDLHDTKPVTISGGHGGHGSHETYPTTPTTYASASYPASTAPTTTAYLTPGNEATTGDANSENWSGTSPFPFGSYHSGKQPKGFDERAIDPTFFSEPSMIKPNGPNTASPMNYYGQAPVGYDRNGMPHHGSGFPPGMPPTPQDYPMTMAAARYSNGSMGLPPASNGNGSPKSSAGQQRPSSVPTPQAMMTTFSSKTVSSTPKRYKCNICQKRFTRPSSLQTHMYSHTGEKPFKCPIEGCGRHFSVVSNLRRHQKIHSSNR